MAVEIGCGVQVSLQQPDGKTIPSLEESVTELFFRPSGARTFPTA